VLRALGTDDPVPAWPDADVAALNRPVSSDRVAAPPILFAKFPPGWAEAQSRAFAGGRSDPAL
jgi:hypothetical protein